jgi:hypothetical protein
VQQTGSRYPLADRPAYSKRNVHDPPRSSLPSVYLLLQGVSIWKQCPTSSLIKLSSGSLGCV